MKVFPGLDALAEIRTWNDKKRFNESDEEERYQAFKERLMRDLGAVYATEVRAEGNIERTLPLVDRGDV